MLVSAAIATALVTTTAAAESTMLEMTSYTNAPGGKEIAAGDYAGAIASVKRSAMRFSDPGRLTAATNLCVAYTKMGAFGEAAEACSAAVDLARSADRFPGARLSSYSATSMALRNRGVLRAAMGDAMGAAADFRKASARGDVLSAAARNLEILEASPAYRLSLAAAAN